MFPKQVGRGAVKSLFKESVMYHILPTLAPCRSLYPAFPGGDWDDINHGLSRTGFANARLDSERRKRRCGASVLVCGLEEIAVRAGTGQFKDEDVLVNLVDEQPVGRDMAFTMIGPVADKRMVVVLGRQCLAVGEFADDVIELRDVKSAAYCKLVVPFEPASPVNGVLFARWWRCGIGGWCHRLSSSNASDSVYRGRVGSCAMRSPSSIAAMVSAFGTWDPSMMKGIRFSRTIVLIYTLITDEAESPTSSQNSTKRFLVGASSENVMFAIVFLHSFELKSRISYTKLTGIVKGPACGLEQSAVAHELGKVCVYDAVVLLDRKEW